MEDGINACLPRPRSLLQLPSRVSIGLCAPLPLVVRPPLLPLQNARVYPSTREGSSVEENRLAQG